MKERKTLESTTLKAVYEKPKLDIVKFSIVDVITASIIDEDQGEWDPQQIVN